MSDLIQPCELCGQQCKKNPGVGDRNDSHYWRDCNTCGSYGITKSVLLTGVLTADIKPLLSSVARRHWEQTSDAVTITTENYKDLVSSAPGKNDVPAKVRYLLGYIARKSQFPGDAITLNSQIDYPLCFAANANEFGFYVRHIKDAGFVDEHSSTQHAHHQYSLTATGWQEAERIPALESPYAFVAMSFSKEGSHGALLTQAFEDAIKPAIEDDAGYREAIRVDRKDFLGDIVFEIIARIKECRFVVADATEHKNGVYFEAGYAMGMGLPVIWTCHKDDMAKAHFDTSHMNHIVWDDVREFRKSLTNRILATIGRGPRAKP